MANPTPNDGAIRAGPPPAKPLEHSFRDLWTRGALLFAVVGVVGSLYLSLEMDLKACPLCFYQRAFVMAAAGLLAFGLILHVPPATQCVLALPAACGGAGIAAWHTYLDWTQVLECPKGVTGHLTAPQESLLVFVILVGLLIGELVQQRKYIVQGVAAALIGLFFCITCIEGVHKDPISPKGPLDGCRKYVPEK